MAKRSKYTQEHVETIASELGYSYLKGIQENQDSIHSVRCIDCGRTDTKTTKILVAGSKCKYKPCKNRGVLTLQYIQSMMEKDGITLVPRPDSEQTDEISREEPLKFQMISDPTMVMTQSWARVWDRKRYGRQAFVANSTPCKPKDKIDMVKVNRVLADTNMELVDSEPTSWASRKVYKCKRCGLNKPYTMTRLRSQAFKGCDCFIAERRFEKVRAIIEERGFTLLQPDLFKAKFHAIASQEIPYKEKENRYRKLRAEIKCRCCGKELVSQCLFQIQYEFLLFCDNDDCDTKKKLVQESDFLRYDKSEEALEYNALALTSKFESLASFKMTLPYAKYRLGFGTGMAPYLKELWAKCGTLNKGWPSKKVKAKSDKAVRECIERSIRNGAKKGVVQLKNAAVSEADRELIAQIHAKFPKQLASCCQSMGYKLRNKWRDMLPEDVHDEIINLNITSRSEFKEKQKSLYSMCSRRGILDEVYERLGWPPVVRYCDMTDDQLLATAVETINTLNCMNITDLEYRGSSALVRAIRGRKNSQISGRIYEVFGWSASIQWQNMKLDDVVTEIKRHDILSISDFHSVLPGAYKHLDKQGLIGELNEIMRWGNNISVHGKRADSLVESIAFSLLELNGIDFTAHVKAPFLGPSGQQRMNADFCLGDYEFKGRKILGEIWACTKDGAAGHFEGYPATRAYKEDKYKQCEELLLGIEGIELYKPTMDLTRYIRHIQERFSQIGLHLTADGAMVKKIRKQVAPDNKRLM